MKVSDGLLYQANNFSRTRSFSLNMELKNELAKIYHDLGHGVLNKNCGTCVRIAMDRLNYELLRGELPALCQKTNDVKPTLHFIGPTWRTKTRIHFERLASIALIGRFIVTSSIIESQSEQKTMADVLKGIQELRCHSNLSFGRKYLSSGRQSSEQDNLSHRDKIPEQQTTIRFYIQRTTNFHRSM
jgi:hypothetical protein